MHVTCTGLHVDVLEGEDLRHEDWFGKWNTEFVMRFEAEKTGSKVYLHKITNAVRSFDSEYECMNTRLKTVSNAPTFVHVPGFRTYLSVF